MNEFIIESYSNRYGVEFYRAKEPSSLSDFQINQILHLFTTRVLCRRLKLITNQVHINQIKEKLNLLNRDYKNLLELKIDYDTFKRPSQINIYKLCREDLLTLLPGKVDLQDHKVVAEYATSIGEYKIALQYALKCPPYRRFQLLKDMLIEMLRDGCMDDFYQTFEMLLKLGCIGPLPYGSVTELTFYLCHYGEIERAEKLISIYAILGAINIVACEYILSYRIEDYKRVVGDLTEEHLSNFFHMKNDFIAIGDFANASKFGEVPSLNPRKLL